MADFLIAWGFLNIIAYLLISVRNDKDIIWADFKKFLFHANKVSLNNVLTHIFLKLGTLIFLYIALPFSIPYTIFYLWRN